MIDESSSTVITHCASLSNMSFINRYEVLPTIKENDKDACWSTWQSINLLQSSNKEEITDSASIY